MGDLSDKQSAQTTKKVGADPSTGIESNFQEVDSTGNANTAIYGGTDNTKIGNKVDALKIGIQGNSGAHVADVDLISGIRRLRTDATVTVEEIFGQDPFPDSYFSIIQAGAIGNTIRLQVAATAVDPTSPDRDTPVVDLTYTLIAADVGDELKLRDNCISYFNAQASMIAAFLRAQPAKDVGVVHVTSTKRSMTGEFYERPTAGDFNVTSTGTTVISLGFDNILSRGKSTSLARDPDSPHRLGILGISGTVALSPGGISNRIQVDARNAGANDITVAGTLLAPVIFTIDSDPNFDLVFTEFRFHFQGGSYKFGQFLNINSTLTNGILVEVKSEDTIFMFDPIKTTDDFKARWSSPNEFDLDIAASGDHVLATKDFGLTAVVLKRTGTFVNPDYVKVYIRDTVTAPGNGFFTADGFKRS